MESTIYDRSVLADARRILDAAIRDVLPDAAVGRALNDLSIEAPVTLIAVGKAAWRMANAAYRSLGGERVKQGVVLTKDGHLEGAIGSLSLYEAGHPVPDERGVAATRRIMDMASGLNADDHVLLLISGGGSALLECPAEGVTLADIADVTKRLLACGASIDEINCVRKRLSRVKGGRLAQIIAPARIDAVILSDVLGDRPDVIASGPVSPDATTCADAAEVIGRYAIALGEGAARALREETPKALPNVRTVVAGNVGELCLSAAREAEKLGYAARVMDTAVSCEAREQGARMAAAARDAQAPCALIWGGETVVHVRGNGRGGRNQEVALSAARGLSGMRDTCVLAAGSDGTDGPTDAAGGLVDGAFFTRAGEETVEKHLRDNDSYPLLRDMGALIMTGPTGTNVNDLYMLLKASR